MAIVGRGKSVDWRGAASECIKGINAAIRVPGKEEAARSGKGHTGERVCGFVHEFIASVVGWRHGHAKLLQFQNGTRVKDPNGRILTASGKAFSIRGHDVDPVDICRVSHECHDGCFRGSHVPNLGSLIHRATYKCLLVWKYGEKHCIRLVFRKCGNWFGSGNVPQNASGITGSRNQLLLTQETTARQEAIVTGHFRGREFASCASSIDRTKIVQSTTRNQLVLRLFNAN
mmetsp:Transcript_22795/g.63376  ORF Transcript_22795/g.63376 Transcript_22795/m.63376 type:complete len:230 (+) Transcript_22795:8244-8933(+)